MSEGPIDEFGRYQLLERIGAGGMGEVFRADMRGVDGFSRIVVVKRMLPELAAESDAVAMFIDEARLAARIVHPNVVQVHDFGKIGLRYFLVMEYVPGCDLSRLLVYLAEQKHKLPLGVAVMIISALLEGLAFAHDLRGADGHPLGLVHRDIAPSNVLLGTSGEIKLTDFGIAKTRERLEHTRIGVIKGKQHYMSPEQASGQQVDARSDLFSVGVVLFKLLTGHRPFRGETGDEVRANIRAGRYTPPEVVNPEISPGMAELLEHALQTSVDERFQTAREFRQALLAEATRRGIVQDGEVLRSLVTEAAMAFSQHQTSPTRPGRVRTPTRQPTEEIPIESPVVPATEPSITSDSTSGTAPPPPAIAPTTSHPGVVPTQATSPTGASTVVIQSRHVVYGVLGLVGLLVATLAIASRLHASSGTATPILRVALRMYPAQLQWFKEQIFQPFAEKEGCKIEVIEFNSTEELSRMLGNGEADVAKVDVEHAPLLVELGRLQRIPPLAERVAEHDFHELRKAIRPDALRIGLFHTAVFDDLYLVPRKLETAIFVYRKSLVDLAVRELPKHQQALDARLHALIGHGLPDHFAINPDPAQWTSWDLIAASWVWAHSAIRGQTAQRYALRAEKRVIMEAVAAGAPEHDPWHVSTPMVDLFYEYAVLRELDVLHPDTYKPIDYAKVREMLGDGRLAAFIENQIDVAILVGNGHGMPSLIDDPNDWDAAPLPRLSDLDHPEAPPLVPEALTEVWGWGWGVPRNSRDPELAMKLILAMDSKDRHGAELEQFPILRVRADVTPTWPVSRRLNELGDAMLSHGRARYLDWPKRAGEMEQIELRIERAFRDLIVERHYRSDAKPIDRAVIESRLHTFLDGD